MAKITPKERELAMINGEKLDMMPIWQINGIVASQNLGYKWKDVRGDAKLSCKIIQEFSKQSGTDVMGHTCIEPNVIVADLPGVELKFADDNYANVMSHYYVEAEDIESKPLYDPANKKECPQLWKYLLDKTTMMAKEKSDFLPQQVSWSVMTTAGFLRGPEALLMDMAIEPDLAQKALHKAAGLVDKAVRCGLEAGCKVAYLADPTASGSLINGETYKTMIAPDTKKIISGFKKDFKAATYIHVCGETAPVAKEICSTGNTLFSIDFMNNLTEIRGLIGDKVYLAGNLNPMDVVWKGTPETVMAESKRIIEETKGTRFVLATGCESPRDTPTANLAAMKKAVEKYAVY